LLFAKHRGDYHNGYFMIPELQRGFRFLKLCILSLCRPKLS